jgi:hypothetical protein
VADEVIDFCWHGLLGATPDEARRSA